MPNSDTHTRRIRLFRNEQLEMLTKISPRTFGLAWSLFLPAIAWCGWGTTVPVAALSLIVGGLLVWTLFEYAMHRYLFHWDLNHAAVQWFVFLIHGNHHDDPNDPWRQVMPLIVSMPIAALVWGASVSLLGMEGTWLFLGWITGYVLYDGIHYACHQWPMRGKLAASLKRHHMRHHYVSDTGNFGISAIFWDHAFGTKNRSRKR